MTTHSKGNYVAYRTGRNAPTERERVARARVAKACEEFCNSPHGAGCQIVYSLEDYNREVHQAGDQHE